MKFINSSKLSRQLLKSIFTLYFSFSFVITLVYFGIEYSNAKKNVLQELTNIEKTFSSAISQAIWELNQNQLEEISRGIQTLAIIDSIEIKDQDSNILIQNTSGKKNESSNYLYNFAIKRNVSGIETILGTVTLYSSPKIVFKRVQSGFLMIAINSIIKTMLLWYLLLIFLRKYINLPLARITGEVSNINLNHLSVNLPDPATIPDNELSLLGNQFQEMTTRLQNEKRKFIEAKNSENIRLEKMVAERTSELKKANEDLYILAHTDFLTGILNRRMFWKKLNEEFQQNSKSKSIYILMIDIDHFKMINDRYGHETGDEVLKTFSTETKNLLPDEKIFFGRLGGEEFSICITDSQKEYVLTLAEKIRFHTESIQIPKDNQTIQFTVSMGVSYRTGTESADTLIRRADKLLYKAKNSGRNQIVVQE